MKRILHTRRLSLRNPTAAGMARWTTSALVIAVGMTMARVTWETLPLPGANAMPPPVTAASAARTMSRIEHIGTVAALHLFGQVAQTQVATSKQIHAPETHLNYTLHGVFASNDPSDAFAIIADGRGVERTYRIGDKIGGTTIHDILPDRVILDRSGHYETLKLPKTSLELGGAAPSDMENPGRVLNAAVTRQLNTLRRSILNKPQRLFDIATFQPVFSQGQIIGYRILPRAHMRMFRAAGLSPQDIVTSVNGIPVTDPSQLANITRQLSTASTLQIGIKRPDGSSDELNINLN